MKIKKIAIIGGGGAMGSWFAKFFLKNGTTVIVSDKNKRRIGDLSKKLKIESAKNNVEAVKKADFVLISVLLQNFEKVVKEIAPHIKEEQIVLDITSIKEKPVKIMHRYIKKGGVLGTHPVFGPGAKDKKQNFVLTPINKKEKTFANKFKNWLKKRGFNVTIMTPRKHDELMNIVLGLTHFIGLVAGDTWRNFNLKELKKVGGTSFKILLNLVENTVNSSPELYAEIQFNLPQVNKVESLFEEKTKEWREIIKNRDKQEFIYRMEKLKKFTSN